MLIKPDSDSANDSIDFLGNKQKRIDRQSFCEDKSPPAKGWLASAEK